MPPDAATPARPGPRWAALAALLLAGLVVAVTVRVGTFVGTHADASGYVAEGHLWAIGRLYRPEAAQLWATWPLATATGSPLGFRPAPGVPGTSVPVYPLGLPLMLAAAERIGGPLAVYLVVPLTAGILVLAAFRLASHLAGPLAGLLAAGLLALDPVVLFHTVNPMSDVPAAALWTTAWLIALGGTRTSAFASGWCAALAVMVRPNLVVLGVVPALSILASGRRAARGIDWRSLFAYAGAAAVGPLVVAWTQATLYGGPLTSSYPGAETFYRLDHLGANARNYWRSFVDLYTAVPLLGLAAAAALRPRWAPGLQPRQRAIVASGLTIIALNVLSYAFFLPYAEWTFVRFFLPAITALFVLLAAVLGWCAAWAWRDPRRRPLVAVVPMAAVLVSAHRHDLRAYALADGANQQRILLMDHYLEAALPPRATVLCFFHSGSIADATGREVIRLDLVPPASLDAVVDELTRAGVPVAFAIDRVLEERQFQALFAPSRYGALDWAPRAEFAGTGAIRYYLAADRDRYLAGARWPVDVLR
ncbi:MAG: hypothetical protein AB7O28_25255 [Vicinamibacterales bacterium]